MVIKKSRIYVISPRGERYYVVLEKLDNGHRVRSFSNANRLLDALDPMYGIPQKSFFFAGSQSMLDQESAERIFKGKEEWAEIK